MLQSIILPLYLSPTSWKQNSTVYIFNSVRSYCHDYSTLILIHQLPQLLSPLPWKLKIQLTHTIALFHVSFNCCYLQYYLYFYYNCNLEYLKTNLCSLFSYFRWYFLPPNFQQPCSFSPPFSCQFSQPRPIPGGPSHSPC